MKGLNNDDLEVFEKVFEESTLNDDDSEVCEGRGRGSGDSLDDNNLIDL